MGFFGYGRSNQSIDGGEDTWKDPADSVEPLHNVVLTDEGYDEHCMQIKALTKHPEIVGHQEVVKQNVEYLAADLIVVHP